MGRSSSSSSPKIVNDDQTVDINKLQKFKEEPHLSGAYIRSLVKQLTSSRPKSVSSSATNNSDGTINDGQDFPKFGGENQQEHPPQAPPPQQQHKKQVRRRLHTSRPYQERLLNMAEARREIVTALKFHRAAMKQQQQQQQQQANEQPPPEAVAPSPPPPQAMQSTLPPFEKTKTRRNNNSNNNHNQNPRSFPSNTTYYSNYLDENSYFAPSFGYDQHPPPPPNNYSYLWNQNCSSIIPPLPTYDNSNFNLPNQTLGLNLNFQDFNNLDTSLYQNYNTSPTFFTSSSSSSSSPAVSISTEDAHPLVEMEVPNFVLPTEADVAGGGLHQAMGAEEMAEIKFIGDQHEMEWNDTVNLVTSACWFKFLKAMEIGSNDGEVKAEEDGNSSYHLFDEVMEFPPWLNSNESCLQTHFDDFCSEDYSQDPALPRMDIEGMDGDWLS